MKKFPIQSALGAIALACASAAHAVVIDFESVDTTNAPFAPLMAGGDYVTSGAYYVNTQEANGVTGSLIGQLSNGSDASTCLNGTCPTGNTTSFLSVYNDGIAHVGKSSGANLVFAGVDAAYIAAPDNASGSTVYFVVEADRTDGSYAAYYYALSSAGSFRTITTSTAFSTLSGSSGTLTSGNVTDLFFYAYYCATSCSAFSTDRAQFAIDNIRVDVTSAVPEPSEWALMALGLTAVAAATRRRRAA